MVKGLISYNEAPPVAAMPFLTHLAAGQFYFFSSNKLSVFIFAKANKPARPTPIIAV